MGPKDSIYSKNDMVGFDRSMVNKVPDVGEEEVEVLNPLKPMINPPLFFCFFLGFFAVVRDFDVSDGARCDISRIISLVAGKFSLVALSLWKATLFLWDGDRGDENPLEPSFGDIGYLEIDLAQEINTETRAVDLVIRYVRKGSDGDITVTNEMARTFLDGWGWARRSRYGRLQRWVGVKRHGWRVALSMSALKAIILLVLDEPSNVRSVFVCDLVATTYFCLIFNPDVSFSKTRNTAPWRRMHPMIRNSEDDRGLFYLAAESLLNQMKEMYTPAVSSKGKMIETKSAPSIKGRCRTTWSSIPLPSCHRLWNLHRFFMGPDWRLKDSIPTPCSWRWRNLSARPTSDTCGIWWSGSAKGTITRCWKRIAQRPYCRCLYWVCPGLATKRQVHPGIFWILNPQTGFIIVNITYIGYLLLWGYHDEEPEILAACGGFLGDATLKIAYVGIPQTFPGGDA